ncbi:MAG: inorganic diphosphatase [Anaerolineales bacterium]|nr:MAG: inorganic diphosphatase [Anaerolineales bacterium]
MNLWRDLPSGPDCPRVVYVVVEIPKGARNKYEYDQKQGFVKLDRVLFSSLHYPGDYGFIPQTLHADGDPLDVLVITNEPTFAGCVIEARPLGVFRLVDKGQLDDKILAVPHTDPLFKDYRTLKDVPSHFLDEMAHFFNVYKDLESAEVQGRGWDGLEAACEEIRAAAARFEKKEGK